MDFNNFVRLDGNLTHAPTFRVTKGGTSVVNFRMATNQRRKNEGVWESVPTYHSCTAWGKQAEVIRDNFNVGDVIKITGSISHGEYTKDNVRHFTTTIEVDSFDFGFKPKKANGVGDGNGEDQSDNRHPTQEEIDEANALAAQASSSSGHD